MPRWNEMFVFLYLPIRFQTFSHNRGRSNEINQTFAAKTNDISKMKNSWKLCTKDCKMHIGRVALGLIFDFFRIFGCRNKVLDKSKFPNYNSWLWTHIQIFLIKLKKERLFPLVESNICFGNKLVAKANFLKTLLLALNLSTSLYYIGTEIKMTIQRS